MIRQNIGVRLNSEQVTQLQPLATKADSTVSDICRDAMTEGRSSTIAQYLGQSQPDPTGERLTQIESVLNQIVGVSSANGCPDEALGLITKNGSGDPVPVVPVAKPGGRKMGSKN